MIGNKVKGMVMSKGSSCGKLAKELGITPTTLSTRLSGKTEFSKSELDTVKRVYNLSNDEFIEIFFTD